ncbi:MAG TPA: filamentous hemagglutinin N-terminal domain-containing protein, partial [Acidisphaera sp.]|nr:filamentous hemagglutinin N-terminal domain-containing protein [Acidisphaera sp.]
MAGSRSRDGTADRIRGGTARRVRFGLLATTALTAAILLHAEPARTQPAAGARPQGGQVVAGSASISTTPSTTTIDQTTQRAAINWNSFNVGSQQTVTFEQPSASSMTLNRVSGPDPSKIAGHIDANGGIVITNPDGVVFYRGSEVNATDLVVSAPGIGNRNFMHGRMAFDRPAKPGAAVVNRGNLTIRQAGLGALVAPEVRNRGTITAKLGHVALAGADAATLDMYGD